MLTAVLQMCSISSTNCKWDGPNLCRWTMRNNHQKLGNEINLKIPQCGDKSISLKACKSAQLVTNTLTLMVTTIYSNMKIYFLLKYCFFKEFFPLGNISLYHQTSFTHNSTEGLLLAQQSQNSLGSTQKSVSVAKDEILANTCEAIALTP